MKWEVKKIGDVCDFVNGFAFKSKDTVDQSEVQLVRMGNLYKNRLDLDRKPVFYPDNFKDKYKQYLLKEGDLIMSLTGTVDKEDYGFTVEIPKHEGFLLLNQRIAKFTRLSPTINENFLLYVLRSKHFLKKLYSTSRGVRQANLSTTEVKKIIISVPSLEEQKRIVGILDESFEAIALAEANTKKNLANTRELFNSYRDKILYQESKEHIKTQLGKEIDLLSGFAFKSEFYTESVGDILLLRGDNIIQGKLRWDDAKRWKKSDLELFSKFKLEENDIVLAMDRPWVNAGLKYSKITKKDLPCLLVQRVARLRSKKNLSNSFLFHLIGSKKFINHILRKQTGIGVPHISGKQIKDFSFFKPSIDEQINIANSLDKIYLQLQKLEAIYQRKLEALAELKQSILQKAFTGQLTT